MERVMGSPFLSMPKKGWIASNLTAFAVMDGFPVSSGHALVITKRLVPTWFDASPEEQADLMALVNTVKQMLDSLLVPRPDGYNVGFNSGSAAGQTVEHVHIHVIPRFRGDVPDPRGGVRHVIPSKANYLLEKAEIRETGERLSLSTGHPYTTLWEEIGFRLSVAAEVDVVSAFVQLSGLDLMERRIFEALSGGARIRVLVGDYLYISDPQALRRLYGWMKAVAEDSGSSPFESRLIKTALLPGSPSSFHPKAWHIVDSDGQCLIVGSSNISAAALRTGVEWNLIVRTEEETSVNIEARAAFQTLWDGSVPLTPDVLDEYSRMALRARAIAPVPEVDEPILELPLPRPWQCQALERLAAIRLDGHPRALVSVATGLGKTWLAAFDALQCGKQLGRRPRVIVIAHRAEILAQAESVLRRALDSSWGGTKVSWYLGDASDLDGDLVIASIQKLSRPEGVNRLQELTFDYAVMDEVHHAEAPSYQRVLAFLQTGFVLGLTATPERTDGVDVVSIFNDVLAWQAGIGDGIGEGSLVPFHYIGVKDDIDFQQIPWRNGRFDATVLEEQVENSARMEKLWSVWNEHPATKTLIFCCSKRHALFTRDWLRARGVSAAAVFSGTGGDLRAETLHEFYGGELAALCAVDLFNEGVDLPFVDRVIMLRPTESKIVFLQQLGRGLRSADGKTRLLVVDFVGNHRIFAQRIIHLLSLHLSTSNWEGLRGWLSGAPADLPPGCLLDIDVEGKDLLRQLVPNGGTAAAEAYLAMRDELGRRPSISELFHRGYLPATIRGLHGSWYKFVLAQGDLQSDEVRVLEQFGGWFRTLETTRLNKSFKAVVIQVLLDRGNFWSGVSVAALSEACRDFLLNHSVLRKDLASSADVPDHVTASVEQWAAWWRRWPLDRWLDIQAGHRWFRESQGLFIAAIDCDESLRPAFEAMTRDLVEYRLAQYAKSHADEVLNPLGDSFIAKVSHGNGRPILFLPEMTKTFSRPVGPVDVLISSGREAGLEANSLDGIWTFRMVKIACNVAHPKGMTGNLLPDLLRSWFGADAGLPGSDFKVRFSRVDGEWRVEPLQVAALGGVKVVEDEQTSIDVISDLLSLRPEGDNWNEYAPVYDLKAAAGGWGPESFPQEIGWKRVEGQVVKEGMFIAQVKGHSMEPKIASGSWCLFRPCPAGSRDKRILLVQFHSTTDPEFGGRYTVKQYRSEKTETEEEWRHDRLQLLPLNRTYSPIEIDEQEARDLVIVGEFVRVIE